MCERVWRIAQDCAKKQGLAVGSRGWLAAASRQIDAYMPSMPEDEASHQLFTTGQKSQAGQAVYSRLELPVWQKYDFSHSFSPYYIYPYTHDSKRASRENFERETLEKTRLTHPQYLLKRLFKFLYSLSLHCQILERLITKTFSHHIHFCERAVWYLGKHLGRNQFHIGWCYGQVEESGKLETK